MILITNVLEKNTPKLSKKIKAIPIFRDSFFDYYTLTKVLSFNTFLILRKPYNAFLINQ